MRSASPGALALLLPIAAAPLKFGPTPHSANGAADNLRAAVCTIGSRRVDLWNGDSWAGYRLGDAFTYPFMAGVTNPPSAQGGNSNRSLLESTADSFRGSIIEKYWERWGRQHVEHEVVGRKKYAVPPYRDNNKTPNHNNFSVLADVVLEHIREQGAREAHRDIVVHWRLGEKLELRDVKSGVVANYSSATCARHLTHGTCRGIEQHPRNAAKWWRQRCVALQATVDDVAHAICIARDQARLRGVPLRNVVRLVTGVHLTREELEGSGGLVGATCDALKLLERRLKVAGLRLVVRRGDPDDDFALLASAPILIHGPGGYSKVAATLVNMANGSALKIGEAQAKPCSDCALCTPAFETRRRPFCTKSSACTAKTKRGP